MGIGNVEQPDNPDQPDLFEFLRTVAIAAYRGKLTRKQAALAVMVALDSDGTTGTGVTVQASKDKDKRGAHDLTVELGISVSQIWRQFKELRDAGLFVQTSLPARGGRSSEGRRARYRCATPPLDLGLIDVADGNRFAEPSGDDATRSDAAEPANVSHDSPSEMRNETGNVSHDPASDMRNDNVSHDQASEARNDTADEPGTCRSFDPERVAVLDETCRTPHAQPCDSPTSNGPTADGPTSPVVPRLPQPQDTRARDNEPQMTIATSNERDRLKAEARAALRRQPVPDKPPDDPLHEETYPPDGEDAS